MAKRDQIWKLCQWFDRGVERQATHMLIFWDGFDLDSEASYPIYVMPAQDPRTVAAETDGICSQYLEEVYDLSLDRQTQLDERMARNF